MKLNKTWSCKGKVQELTVDDNNCFTGYETAPCDCKNLTPTLNKKRKRKWVSLDCSRCGKSYTYEEVERRLKKTIEG